MKTADKKLKEYVEEINGICPIETAVLFGSYAKGTYGRESDIDVALFSKKINDSNRHEYMSLFLRRILKYGLDIQPVAFNLKEYSSGTEFISEEIKKNGKVIFGKRP